MCTEDIHSTSNNSDSTRLGWFNSDSTRLGWLCAPDIGFRCCPAEHLHPLPVWDESDRAVRHSANDGRIRRFLLRLSCLASHAVLWDSLRDGIQPGDQCSFYTTGRVLSLQSSATCAYYKRSSVWRTIR